jgi:uncharacterized membrane protein YhhN
MNIMLKKYPYFNIFYFLIVVSNIVVLYYLTEYRSVAKPMIVASLIGFYITHAKKQSPGFIMALIFALMGDIFLMIEGEAFFILGLGSFLLMQILYIVEFLKDKTGFNNKSVIPIIGLSLIGAGFIFVLWPNLGNLKWPVTLYVFAVCTMVASAILRRKEIRWYSFVVVGVFLFFISDAWIALTKFDVISDHMSSVIIMISYMIAQYLIVRGMVEKEIL